MVPGRVGSYLRAVQSFGLGEVSLMSALGSCGCVSLYAVDLDGFEGWAVSLLICVEKAMDISSLSNVTVQTRVCRP